MGSYFITEYSYSGTFWYILTTLSLKVAFTGVFPLFGHLIAEQSALSGDLSCHLFLLPTIVLIGYVICLTYSVVPLPRVQVLIEPVREYLPIIAPQLYS